MSEILSLLSKITSPLGQRAGTAARGVWRKPAAAFNQGPGRRRGLHSSAVVLVCLLFSACSGLRYIPENEKLYTGTKVKVNYPEKPKNAAALQTELEGVVRPQPNFSFLGMRPKLYFWHLGVGKTKGLGHFLADKFGEPPVLLSQVKIAATKDLMVNRLQNRGYFHASVGHEVKTKANTANVDYTATSGPVYKIKEVNFPTGDWATLTTWTCSPRNGCASTRASRTRGSTTSRPMC